MGQLSLFDPILWRLQGKYFNLSGEKEASIYRLYRSSEFDKKDETYLYIV